MFTVDKREITWSWLALSVTLGAIAIACFYYAGITVWGGSSYRLAEIVAFLIASPLLYGNLIYQLSRLGALQRERAHCAASRRGLECIYEEAAPALTVLIPSYKEEPRVLRQTVLSAALLEYPGRRIVVLIDDPPGDHASRMASLNVVCEVKDMLTERVRTSEAEFTAYCNRVTEGRAEPSSEIQRLAWLYRDLAVWFEARAVEAETDCSGIFPHVDSFFAEHIFREPASAHRARADAILAAPMGATDIDCEYARLAALMSAEITSFERKTYVNLSHMPNKAMNLNAYIGLLGRNFRVVPEPSGIALAECAEADADLRVPGAEFLLTLDADSIVMPDYALRLMRVMQSDRRVAVAQTPYSAFPNAPTPLERTAGATTDIQYIAHQGSSRFSAAYWVGANALLRVSALQDIRTEVEERGHIAPVFVQDRTVIEDTGSTIDLIHRGWRVYNYPARLAYSATPPDFGALVIQRRRWSNGGLIILPDLIRFCLSRGEHRAGIAEAFVRVHYLVSPAVGSAVMLALLLYPLDPIFSGILLPLASAPYYFLYGRDLIRSGYQCVDLLRVYALNLMLLPVQLIGVLLSLRQAATGRKAPFGRTPKVGGRTSVPLLYPAFNAAMLMTMLVSSAYAIITGNYARALFPIFNAAFYVYGLTMLSGLSACWHDAKVALRELRRRRHRREFRVPRLLPAAVRLIEEPASAAPPIMRRAGRR